MNSIAVIICNYNKKEYVKKCLESLFLQSKKDFDVVVVDNASTDGSAEELSKLYRNKITLICNKENLGGSGGFNTGIRRAMEGEYRYLVLLDNDVVLKEDCIEQLYDDMKKNLNIGIMGTKILKMDIPDMIQEFAPTVNYENMTFDLHYSGDKVDVALPHLKVCDYVPACALIVRREVIERIGYMPEENFIYYDDITWGVRCSRAGFEVVANSMAVVWHKGGAKINPTTFGNYYLTRNKTIFFMRNGDKSTEGCDKAGIDALTEKILMEIFEGIYSCANNDMPNIARTRFDAFLDAILGVKGKANPLFIREREYPKKRIEELCRGKEKILIYMHGKLNETRRILGDIRNLEESEGMKYCIELVSEDSIEVNSIMGYDVQKNSVYENEKYDLILHICRHIFDLELEVDEKIWVDGWANVVSNALDRKVCRGFKDTYKLFRICFWDRVRESIERLTEAEISRYGNQGEVQQ